MVRKIRKNMNYRHIKWAVAMLATVVIGGVGSTWAVVVTDLPVTTVGGRKCYYYDVKLRESIYSVSNDLGVSRELIVDYNPSAADGLKPRMRLYFPVDVFKTDNADATMRPAVYAAAAGVETHVVKRGESVYGVARKYGMTADELVALNPWADEGVHEGQVLKIVAAASSGSSQAPVPVPDASGYIPHTIAEDETLLSIAEANKVPLEVLLDANPAVDALRYHQGQLLNIPATPDAIARHSVKATPAPNAMPPLFEVKVSEGMGPGAKSAPEASAPVSPDATIQEAPATQTAHVASGDVSEPPSLSASTRNVGVVVPADTLRVAVLLPFMLNEREQSRATQLYTEFFKGMLMAADNLRTDMLQPVNFSFFDTEASLDRVRQLVANPRVANADLVITPDHSDQIDAIIEAVSPQTVVLNIFAVKDDSHLSHPNVIQMNTSTEEMYKKAIDAFIAEFSDRLPVFISRISGQADKESFVAELKNRLDAEGIAYRDVTFSSILRDADIAEFDPDVTPLVFVPVTGSKSEFAKYSQAIEFKRNNAEKPESVKLWGYPEWVTFRGESADELCNLDATIYSRFLADEHNYKANDLKKRYKALYGVEMFDAVPTQGILGYDTAMFVVDALRHKAITGSLPTVFNGVQNSLTLHPVNSGVLAAPGLINNLLFIIHYHPGGNIESNQL